MENVVVSPLTADMIYGLNGFRRDNPLPVDPEFYSEELLATQDSFAERQNKSDSISRAMLYPEESTPECKMDLNKLELRTFTKREENEYHPFRLFFKDNPLYFILHNACEPRSEDAAIISFCVFGSEKEARIKEEYKRYPKGTLHAGDVYISQIQGPSYAAAKHTDQGILKGLRWPLVMTSQVILWSREVGFPRVILEPHEFNEWHSISRNIDNRGKMRYDLTAKRLGFDRDYPENPYIWNNNFFYEMTKNK